MELEIVILFDFSILFATSDADNLDLFAEPDGDGDTLCSEWTGTEGPTLVFSSSDVVDDLCAVMGM